MTTTDTSTSDTGPARRPKDPSVVVGMACRVPGATNPRDLWEVLEQRKDLQRKMPEDRYNADSFYHPQGTNKGTVRL
jgi:acyl transferase domain-containing protein